MVKNRRVTAISPRPSLVEQDVRIVRGALKRFENSNLGHDSGGGYTAAFERILVNLNYKKE